MVGLRNETSPGWVCTWAREHPWLADALLAAVLLAILLPVSVMMFAPSAFGFWLALGVGILALVAARRDDRAAVALLTP